MKTTITLLLLTLILSSCATTGVMSKKTKDVDFTQYRTYKIMPYVNEEDALNKKIKINDTNKKRIEEAIMASLSIRGLDTATQSDVILLYAVDIDMQKSYSRTPNYSAGGYYNSYGGTFGGAYGGTYYSYNGGYHGGYGYDGSTAFTSVEEHNYEMGRLRLGLIDIETGDLLWLGSTSEKIKDNPRKTEKQISRIVRKILMDFPIPYVKK